ncbi:MAG: PAS domain S-box protein [Gammaproteobacteria bacterium]|nr:PAS domain S-box protein [Gammaproteobacteria bacterium]MCP5196518.1 PAS domain S-box protein [Gammaproteobacteria bacterium]
MKRRSESPEDWDVLREKIIGLGERSVRKSYYPELQHQYAELKRFRQLIDQSSELILFFDVVSLQVVDANDTACQALERARENLLGVCLAGLHPALDETAREAVAKPDQPIPTQAMYTCADRSIRVLDGWTKVVVVDDRPTGMLVVRDISDRIRAEKALRESEAKYRRLHESIRDAFASVDMSGALQECNQAFQTMLGYSEEELRQLTYQDLTPEQWRAFEADVVEKQILVRGYSDVYEKEYCKKDGTILPVELRAFLLRDTTDRPTGMWAIVRDITERKRAEAALRASEERFAKAFHVNPVPMAITEIETGRFLDANKQTQRMLGYTREEMIDHTSTELGVWVDSGTRERMIAQLRVDRTVREIPTRLRTKTGEIREVLWSVEIIRLGEQDVLLSLMFDITERKQAEKLLGENTERLRLALQAACMGTWEWDIIGNHVVWSPETQRIFGISADEFGGTYEAYLGFIASEIREEVNNEVQTFLSSAHAPAVIQYEHGIIRGDGKAGWVEVRGTLFLDKQNQATRMTGICVDVTERKRAEEELQRYREHLEELIIERTDKLHQAMDQLVQSEKLAALGQLVAGVAHELNTPLGNARTVASALGEHLHVFATAVESGALRRSQMETFLSQGREAVDLLERNTARAAELIGQFKQVAVDQTSMRRRYFNLYQTIEELLVTLQPQFKHTTHRIELDMPADLDLDSYPGPLEQVIVNLVSNSLTHGFVGMEAGRIQLQAHALGSDQVTLRYADNGIGIPTNVLNHIFEPFFTTRLGQGGSGLGLYIVYNLVTGVLGGAVQVTSSPGQGVTFTLALPRIAPDRPAAS